MSEIQRWYHCEDGMYKSQHGQYVLYDDHEEAIAAMKAEVERLGGAETRGVLWMTASVELEREKNALRTRLETAEKEVTEAKERMLEIENLCFRASKHDSDLAPHYAIELIKKIVQPSPVKVTP